MMPAKRKPNPPKNPPRASLPEERARDAIAHEEAVTGSGDRVRMTFRVVLARQAAETLAARPIREEKNIAGLVTEILEVAATSGQEDQ
jgi:hypothetical protein